MNPFAAVALFALLAPLTAYASTPRPIEDLFMAAFLEHWDAQYIWSGEDDILSAQRTMVGGKVVSTTFTIGVASLPSQECSDAPNPTVNGVPVPPQYDATNHYDLADWYSNGGPYPTALYGQIENLIIEADRIEARHPQTNQWTFFPGYTFRFEVPVEERATTIHADRCAIEIILMPHVVEFWGEAVHIDGIWYIDIESPTERGRTYAFAEGSY